MHTSDISRVLASEGGGCAALSQSETSVMKIQVLCVCALICAVVCRSLDEERQSYTPREQLSHVKSRVKRQIIGSCGCPRGYTKLLGLCIPCAEYEDILEEPCPPQC